MFPMKNDVERNAEKILVNYAIFFCVEYIRLDMQK